MPSFPSVVFLHFLVRPPRGHFGLGSFFQEAAGKLHTAQDSATAPLKPRGRTLGAGGGAVCAVERLDTRIKMEMIIKTMKRA